MPQTVGGVAGSKWQLQLSTDGTTWADKSGGAVSVTPGGEEQNSGNINTADGDAPIVTAGGKHSPATVEIRGVYTKISAELWDFVRDRWEVAGAKTIYARWAPEGGIGTVVGNEQFTLTSDAGLAFAAVIKQCIVPPSDAASAGPMACMVRLEAPKVTRALTTTT